MEGYGDTLLVLFSEIGSGQPSLLYELNTGNNQFKSHPINDLTGNIIYSIWYDRAEKLIYSSTGNGIYQKKFDNTHWVKSTIQLGSAVAIKGNSSNNIYMAGGFYKLAHYNGSTWKILTDVAPKPSLSGNWGEISVKNGIGAIKGNSSGWAFLLRFKQLS